MGTPRRRLQPSSCGQVPCGAELVLEKVLLRGGGGSSQREQESWDAVGPTDQARARRLGLVG